ncbi:MAG TPA: sulfocyanin-like copper-binding protein [Solirubrobacter sp.]
MSWFAILLALAALGGSPSAAARKQCAKAAVSTHQKQQCKTAGKKKTPVAKVKPRSGTQPSTPGAQRDPSSPTSPGGDDPSATPTPTPTPTPKPGATPTPTPVPTATPDPIKYPARTGVDLSEWTIRPTYRTLATGRVVFNAANLGEDDHNLSVRSGATEYGKVDLSPGDTDSLVLQLPPGTYTLYCSLQGHEEQGMRADIIVR